MYRSEIINKISNDSQWNGLMKNDKDIFKAYSLTFDKFFATADMVAQRPYLEAKIKQAFFRKIRDVLQEYGRVNTTDSRIDLDFIALPDDEQRSLIKHFCYYDHMLDAYEDAERFPCLFNELKEELQGELQDYINDEAGAVFNEFMEESHMARVDPINGETRWVRHV